MKIEKKEEESWKEEVTNPWRLLKTEGAIELSARSASESCETLTAIAITSIYHYHITFNMFRTALLRATRAAAQSGARAAPVARTAVRSPFITSRISSPATRIAAIRCYASSSGLGQEEVTGRILDLLKNFDKVTKD